MIAEQCARRLAAYAPMGASRRTGVGSGRSRLVLRLAAPSPGDKSIAVLPFRNLSSDPTNAYFAEGVQDDILSRLVKIRDLKVISRLGASSYPADVPRDLRAIGRTLGVRHLLEGSLRRSGDRVLLRVALIDSRDGHRFGLKAMTANSPMRSICRANWPVISLMRSMRLSVPRRGGTCAPSRRAIPTPTYCSCGDANSRETPLSRSPLIRRPKSFTAQAVALDPGFAIAHARVASTLGLLYRFRGPSDELKERARAEAREALRLQPDLGEAHLAQGLYYYRIERDFARALPELEIARRLLPNDTEAESTLAYIYRRQGRWREARAGLERRSVPRSAQSNL